VLPGFNLTLGYTLLYLSLIVLIPLSALVLQDLDAHLGAVLGRPSASPRVLASYRLTFGASLIAALVNVVFGLLVAWVLVRYKFPRQEDRGRAGGPAVCAAHGRGRHLADGAAGRQRLGGAVLGAAGHPARLQAPTGVVIALIFIGLPFVVRTVQPVLEDAEKELEEAATCLGATRWQTFRHVIFPSIAPALLTGFAMAFARAGG
jgi:sulfate transport system permease protein